MGADRNKYLIHLPPRYPSKVPGGGEIGWRGGRRAGEPHVRGSPHARESQLPYKRSTCCLKIFGGKSSKTWREIEEYQTAVKEGGEEVGEPREVRREVPHEEVRNPASFGSHPDEYS